MIKLVTGNRLARYVEVYSLPSQTTKFQHTLPKDTNRYEEAGRSDAMQCILYESISNFFFGRRFTKTRSRPRILSNTVHSSCIGLWYILLDAYGNIIWQAVYE